MTEEFDIEYEFEHSYDDYRLSYEGYDYLECDEHYRKFSASWDPDDPIYWIHLDIEDGDYYYVKISYEEVRRLEIGKKKQALLQLSDSPFDKEYFLVYNGEKISPKSREQFISKIEHLLKLKSFL